MMDKNMKGAHEKKKSTWNICLKEGNTTTLLQWKSWNAIGKNKHHLMKVSSQGQTIKFKVFN